MCDGLSCGCYLVHIYLSPDNAMLNSKHGGHCVIKLIEPICMIVWAMVVNWSTFVYLLFVEVPDSVNRQFKENTTWS